MQLYCLVIDIIFIFITICIIIIIIIIIIIVVVVVHVVDGLLVLFQNILHVLDLWLSQKRSHLPQILAHINQYRAHTKCWKNLFDSLVVYPMYAM